MLFRSVPVAAGDLALMARFAAAMEAVVRLPEWRRHALAWAPEIARFEPQGKGVFFGYDFHLAPGGPKLIEINTNAGGGLLCAWRFGPPAALDDFLEMFQAERGGPLAAVAIVDDSPAGQYLYPEFLLLQDLFERRGIRAVICDPRDLRSEEHTSELQSH